MLLERDTELRAVDDRLNQVDDGQGAVLIVEGSPGIGKTAILHAVADRAATQGFDVLRARGTPMERSFPFGVARQLLERRLMDASAAQRRALLAGAARDAPGALGIGPADAEADQGLRGIHGLYWLAANLAGSVPVALMVDDAHWADRPSLSWMAYAADRLAGVRLLLVIATRDAEPGAEQDLLDTLAAGDRATVLRPRALTGAAVTAVVGERFGREPAPEFSVACERASGGNPLLLTELVRELATEGVEPSGAAAAGVLDFGADGVTRTVRRRLAALGPEAVGVAQCVAVIGEDEPIALIAEVAGLAEAVVRRSAVDLIAIEMFTHAPRPAFVHPLVRAAVQRGVAPLLRVELHARAARAIAADGAPAERVAVHLLHVDPSGDDWVVRTLMDAAEDAARRGAPDIAARFAERALAEPPPTARRRVEVLRVLGTAEATLLAGDFEGHLREAIGLSDDPVVAGECALTLGRARLMAWDLPGALDVLEPFLETAPAGSDVAVRLEAEFLGTAMSAVPLRERAAALVGRRLSQLDAGAALDPRLTGPLSGLLIDQPPTRRATQLARTVINDATFRAEDVGVWLHAFHALLAGGAYRDAITLAEAARRSGRRRGAATLVGWAWMGLADAFHRAGAVGEAHAAATEGIELFETLHIEPEAQVLAASAASRALVSRGALPLAERMLSGVAPAPGSRSHVLVWALVDRANLRRAQGRLADAIADLRAAEAVFEPGEFTNPYQCRWHSPLALLLAAVGQRDEARVLAAAEVAAARRFEAPVQVGVALSASGVVTGDVEQLREAAGILAHTEARLEHAQALVRLGSALDGEEGRQTLRAGLDLAARCGATPLADEAHQALIAAGGRPRRDRRFITGPESLTAGEFRVARLVADGLSNREAAQQLYVTQAAVQFHLRNVFRKLDITSRTQLSAVLAGEAPMAAAKP